MAPKPSPSHLTLTQWLICVIASIGFAFDTYELLILPLIVGPAIGELVGAAAGSAEYSMWVGRMFYLPAFAGGLFGLLGGYLTDRFGRRRVLTFSILLYAVSAFLAGFSTNIWMLLVLRTTTFIGVCVEFVAAVAWLAELFDDPVQREKVLGYTQAFSSLGGLLVAIANGLCIALASRLPAVGGPDSILSWLGEVKDPHAAWRYTLMSGVIPALPLILIRPFLPESPAWAKRRAEGTLKRPSIMELFSPALRRTTVITTLMFALAYGAAFGAIQHIPRIVPGLAEVKAAQEGKTPAEKKKVEQAAAATYTKWQEVGGLVGRCVLAALAVIIASRVRLLRLFLIPGLVVLPITFAYFATHNQVLGTINLGGTPLQVSLLHVGLFLSGVFTIAQFSFWGNYLPRVYPLHLRGTGEAFAANIGGRMVGTSFAWLTATLAVTADKAFAPTKLAYVAAGVGAAVYLGGLVLTWVLPEPDAAQLPE